jgi:hypothetical protein
MNFIEPTVMALLRACSVSCNILVYVDKMPNIFCVFSNSLYYSYKMYIYFCILDSKCKKFSPWRQKLMVTRNPSLKNRNKVKICYKNRIYNDVSPLLSKWNIELLNSTTADIFHLVYRYICFPSLSKFWSWKCKKFSPWRQKLMVTRNPSLKNRNKTRS